MALPSTGKDTLDGLVLLANSGQTGTYNVWFDNFQVVPIPEPSSMTLAAGLGVGLVMFFYLRLTGSVAINIR